MSEPGQNTENATLSTEARIEQALDTIRGYLQQDGGDVRIHQIDESDGLRVEIEFLGACVACSMSEMTMKAGVEQAIRKALPNVKEVRAVNI
jgi:Fe-S cluster biogenesis protein NfuA